MQIKDVTCKTDDEIAAALHDCDYNEEAAISYLLEGKAVRLILLNDHHFLLHLVLIHSERIVVGWLVNEWKKEKESNRQRIEK